MSRIRLLSTDFDGTLIPMGSEEACPSRFAAALNEHHGRGGLWAINTGRSLDHAVDGLRLFNAPLEPHFLLTHEREIYRKRADGSWIPHGDWNSICHRKHIELFGQALEIFAFIEQLAQETEGITVLYEEKAPAGLVTSSEEVMEFVVNEIQREAARLPDFSFQRNSIYLRFCHVDYHKGSALGELCRLEQIPADSVFAAGDHFNDISMLDGSYAKMIACPANAIDPVKELVRCSQGYIAERCWADGIAEAVEFYESRRNDVNPPGERVDGATIRRRA